MVEGSGDWQGCDARHVECYPLCWSEFHVSTHIGIFTQMTQCQNFDATPGMDRTVFLVLSIGRHVKFDARASKFLTPA